MFMTAIAVGQPAPVFRLPSAQGSEVGLDDYRGKQNVIVWFTKGMGCPFCRSQMSQLARGYQDIRKLGAEVLEVSVSPLPRARLYAQKFQLPFPYLCDPDFQVRRLWGLESREHGLAYYAVGFFKGMAMPKPPNDYGNFPPPFDEMKNVMHDDDMGFFLVDKQGVVRYSLAASYMAEKGSHPLPANDEILAELGKLT
jgi:peroxiredoxin